MGAKDGIKQHKVFLNMANYERATNVEDFIGECNGGALKDKLAMALSDAGLAQVIHNNGNKKAQVSITFTFQQVGDNDQVLISHKLATNIPTKRGKKVEEDTTDTAFFVGKGGKLTIDAPKEDDSGQFNLDASNSKVDKETGEIKKIRQIK